MQPITLPVLAEAALTLGAGIASALVIFVGGVFLGLLAGGLAKSSKDGDDMVDRIQTEIDGINNPPPAGPAIDRVEDHLRKEEIIRRTIGL